MNNILKLGVPLVLLVSVYSRAADTDLRIHTTKIPGAVGGNFKNLYATASREQAKAKLERFRQRGVPITLEEFLGRKLLEVRVITDESGDDRAPSLIRELLASVVLQPGVVGGPSCDGDTWPNFTTVSVRAYLDYGDGRIGILESDGPYLFFEDGDGTYWWYRAPPEDGAVNRSQRTNSEINSFAADATDASGGAPLGKYVSADVSGALTLTLAADGSYLIALREKVLGPSEHGKWHWSEHRREFRLEPKTGDLQFAVRRLRVDERHPERLLWIPDLDPHSLSGAIDYASFVRQEDR